MVTTHLELGTRERGDGELHGGNEVDKREGGEGGRGRGRKEEVGKQASKQAKQGKERGKERGSERERWRECVLCCAVLCCAVLCCLASSGLDLGSCGNRLLI